MNISDFKTLPIIGILRGISEDMLSPTAEVCSSCGLKALEITMNTKEAPRLIGKMKELSDGRFAVGAGTVTHMDQLKEALEAGAEFIVSPVVNQDVIKYCADKEIPVFPGAFTPTEVWQAWSCGATMVKLFPANTLGPKYLKDLHGPLDDVQLLVCGGVSTDNVKDYFANGAAGIAFGSSIFNLEWMQNGQFDKVKHGLSQLIAKTQLHI